VTDSNALLRDLRQQVRTVAADLHERDPRSKPEETDLAAVAWVMATVFVRYCEDNRLIDVAFLAGPTDSPSLAREQQAAYFGRHPEQGNRDWIVTALDRLSASAATMRLFDGLYDLMRRHPVSHQAASRLIGFWRQTAGTGRPVHEFTDPSLDAEVLSDLYASLSDSAKITYALVVTPGFVADFIVDRTVGSAVATFGVRGLRLIDPVCGSGTFLLRAFQLVLAAWTAAEPTTGQWDQVSRSLTSVHGVDKNPVAVAICRFRLLLAAMTAAGASQFADVPALPLIVSAGDSLLPVEPTDRIPDARIHADLDDYTDWDVGLLSAGSYHAVIGNPPYMTVRDSKADRTYRSLYPACRGKYALTVPFIVRFFGLARPGGDEAGYVGLIVSNSFMKREFGRSLVEDFLPQVDLSGVVDTSGAYIPGHGTPTVILLGRARAPSTAAVRTVMGVRGEPAPPADPCQGLVWTAIEDQVDRPGTVSEWVSSQDLERGRFWRHPWVLTGSAASDLLATLEAWPRLVSFTARIGYVAASGSDEVFVAPAHVFRRLATEEEAVVPVATGSDVRDWKVGTKDAAFLPVKDGRYVRDLRQLPRHQRRLWPYRTTLGSRHYFGGQRFADTGREWYDWHQVTYTPNAHPWSLVFAWVATLGHFALLSDDIVPLQSAPVIKLPATADDSVFPRLLAVLNSSAACFWLKQYSQSKGAPRADQLRAEESWEQLYEFTAMSLGELPVPGHLPAERGAELDALAREPTHEQVRGRMIALQEELDWDVYYRYGLLTDAQAARLIAAPESVPEVSLGERAFEIVMARRIAAGDLDTQWFERHQSVPVTEIPAHWPDAYRRVVAARIEFIMQDRNIGLIERPEYKRRWPPVSPQEQEEERLKTWLLDRCEARDLWFDESGAARPMTVSRLADRLSQDPEAMSVARQLAGENADLHDVLAAILDAEHVPYLAQFRYKAEGLRKRAVWEHSWDLQRDEDSTGVRLDIPVPPKYTASDFQRPVFWRQRGKLDVPKERFISYPYASPDSDGSLLLGWAGWDHREQAAVIITLIEERSTADGWDTGRLTPLIAGLAEIMPWVRQWHDDLDPASGMPWAEAFDAYLGAQLESRQLAAADLVSWKAPAPRRGRPPKKTVPPRPKGG
jgi:Domain of unknown function (DUF7008)/Eco57I restriction-modification methylase